MPDGQPVESPLRTAQFFYRNLVAARVIRAVWPLSRLVHVWSYPGTPERARGQRA